MLESPESLHSKTDKTMAVLQAHHAKKEAVQKMDAVAAALLDNEKPNQKPNTSHEILLKVWRLPSLYCESQHQESETANLISHFLSEINYEVPRNFPLFFF